MTELPTRLGGNWLGRKSAEPANPSPSPAPNTSTPPAPLPAPSSPSRTPSPSARYDAARTGAENREHWRGADSLSPNAAANAQDRKILRERARYEVANNGFAFGAANSLAEDAIGTGPRLQLFGLPEDAARQVEDLYAAWAAKIGYADSLRLLYRSGVIDGECFGLATDNPLVSHPVTLDFRVFESDLVTDSLGIGTHYADPTRTDGIEHDRHGNPVRYTILRHHPGDGWGAVAEHDVYPASQVYHWFRPDRPGQSRGVSWMTPALPLFAQLRRYTLAVLTAAETAANIAGVLTTDQPPGEESITVEAMDEIALPRGALLTAPEGWDVSQLKAEQPTQTFGDFRTQILLEIGRTMDMPLNRITGNSSGYNYSSGRLDYQGYQDSVWRHRERLRLRVLDRLFMAWLEEAMLVGILPAGLPPFAEWVWDWQWDAFGGIDPIKEAQAAQALLDANLSDLAEQCAARGRRWDQVLRQRAREKALLVELGLTPVQAPATTPPANNQPGQPVPEDDQTQEVPNVA